MYLFVTTHSTNYYYSNRPDKLFIDFISIAFSVYPFKIMIAYLDDWYLFCFYQVFELVYKVFSYFIFLSRPFYRAYDYSNLVLRELAACIWSWIPWSKKTPMKKMKEYSFEDRYQNYVRGMLYFCLEYYLIANINNHCRSI
jgi:hypothetical protein